MAMKQIKPQYGKVVPPTIVIADDNGEPEPAENIPLTPTSAKKQTQPETPVNSDPLATAPRSETIIGEKPSASISGVTSAPNPFLQSKEVFSQANLTKIGYRMRSEYVEILDIIKKLKKGGYTLEAVLDDALTYYFEQSEDGKNAIRKAEIFYS
jgi:hypothetical protein